jgi:hypothetical protein
MASGAQWFLRITTPHVVPVAGNQYRLGRLTRGAALTVGTTDTVAGPTSGVQVTETVAADEELAWFTPPLSAITISGTVTFNVWMAENNMSANVCARVRVERCDRYGAVISTIVNAQNGTTEIPVTTRSAQNWTATPTSTTLADGDRLKITVWGDDAASNMGSGFTFTLGYNGATGAADGDSYVTFAETLVERVELTETLTAFWKMEEASGDREDCFSAFDLTDGNTVGQNTGQIGNAADLVRANSEYLLSTAAGLDLSSTTHWSFCAWVRPTGGFAGYYTILGSGVGGNQKRYLLLEDVTGKFFRFDAADFGAVTGDAWHFLVYVFVSGGTDTGFELGYRDNVLGGSRNGAIPTPVNGNVFVGAASSTAHHFNGRIDAVGHWIGRALSEVEVEDLWNSGAGKEVCAAPPGGAHKGLHLLGVGH